MNTQAPRNALTADASPPGTPPDDRRNLRAADWLYRFRAASVIWLIARPWLGYGWLNAGYRGLDRLILPVIRNRFRPGYGAVTPAPSPPTVPAPARAS